MSAETDPLDGLELLKWNSVPSSQNPEKPILISHSGEFVVRPFTQSFELFQYKRTGYVGCFERIAVLYNAASAKICASIIANG